MAKKPHESSKNGTAGSEREIPLDYQFPPDLEVPKCANHMLAQLDEHGFYLSFFHVPPPILLGNATERKRAFEEISALPARCVGRVAVSEPLIERIIAALQGQLEKARAVRASIADKKLKDAQ